MAKIMLVGLDQSVSIQISRVVLRDRHQIDKHPMTVAFHETADADLLFLCGDDRRYLPLLRAIRVARPRQPVVVVTRLPETNDWLDALEAGATDYCAAPFELTQVKWVLDAALKRTRPAAA